MNKPLFVTTLVLCAVVNIANGGVYVDSSVGSSGSGTSASPFKTIKEAAAAVSANEDIFVRGGSDRTYTFVDCDDSVVIPVEKTGVKIRGCGEDWAPIDDWASSNSMPLVTAEGYASASKTKTGSNTYNAPIVINAADCVISGIKSQFTRNSFQENNKGGTGLIRVNADNVVVEHCCFRMTGDGGYSCAPGAGVCNGGAGSTNFKFRRNYVWLGKYRAGANVIFNMRTGAEFSENLCENLDTVFGGDNDSKSESIGKVYINIISNVFVNCANESDGYNGFLVGLGNNGYPEGGVVAYNRAIHNNGDGKRYVFMQHGQQYNGSWNTATVHHNTIVGYEAAFYSPSYGGKGTANGSSWEAHLFDNLIVNPEGCAIHEEGFGQWNYNKIAMNSSFRPGSYFRSNALLCQDFVTGSALVNIPTYNIGENLADTNTTLALGSVPLFVETVDKASPNYYRANVPRGNRMINGGYTEDGLYPAYIGALPPLPIGRVGTMFYLGSPEKKPDMPDDPPVNPPVEDDPGEVTLSRQLPWNIQVLDSTHFVIQYDMSYDEFVAYTNAYAHNGNNFNSAVNTALANRSSKDTEVRGTYTVTGNTVASTSYHIQPNGQTILPVANGRGWAKEDANLMYDIYVTLNTPLVEGATNTVVTPDSVPLHFVYSENTPSPLFKVNQVGYMASATEKYVYFGGWLGTGGAFPVPSSTAFEVVNTADSSVVKTGSFVNRTNDGTFDNKPLSGENTYEADISSINEPGTYYIRIPGVGRSMDFRITDDAAADQFAVHMLGLFNQRCGCSQKTAEYTPWPDAACHLDVRRGLHPSDESDAFAVIQQNMSSCTEHLSLPGGWHDAADYDRRTFHLGIVNDLCNLYLMSPEKFTDNQLSIPERGNGIPDILDEAYWGIKHLIAGQQSDGGVGLWIETVRHPINNDQWMPSEDTLNYCLAKATRNSSMQYCASAAILARALYKANTAESIALADSFTNSIMRAWNFARSGVAVSWQMKNGNGEMVTYTDSSYIEPVEYTKAVLNIAEIMHDRSYLDLLGVKMDFKNSQNQTFNDTLKGLATYCINWESESRTAYCFNELKLAKSSDSVAYGDSNVNALYDRWVAKSTEYANARITRMNTAFQYRNPAQAGWAMAWGKSIPLRQGMWFCTAHYLTGEQRYLDAANLTCDFQTGCNPNGTTYTTFLGKLYPIRYLSLHSLSDGIDEYVGGVTPYRNTYNDFGRLYSCLTPSSMRTPILTLANNKPIWRRWECAESIAVGVSEYTVWETMSPCAAMTGYLMTSGHTTPDINWRQPASDIRNLPGYWALP